MISAVMFECKYLLDCLQPDKNKFSTMKRREKFSTVRRTTNFTVRIDALVRPNNNNNSKEENKSVQNSEIHRYL